LVAERRFNRLFFFVFGDRGQREESAMKTIILAYVIAVGGLAMIVFGLWGLYVCEHGKGR
jgi:hypothetical protein